MEDKKKSKERLIEELIQLHQRTAELEALVTEHEQKEASLREGQAHLAGILEIASEAIISVDEDQRIILFNRGAEEIFGYRSAEAMGQSLDMLLPEKSVNSHRRHMASFAASAETARYMSERVEIFGRRRNGEIFPAEASISKHELDAGRIFTVVLRDITERKETEDRQQKLIEELDAFGHTVAHDLSAPLNQIKSYVDLLQEQVRLPEELQSYLNGIARKTRKMNNIIDELQLMAGVRQANVEMKPLNMARIVAEAQHRLVYMIEEYQAEIFYPDSWPVAVGHAPWVEEIWANYISNAIKYGGSPPRLRLGSTICSKQMIRFWVRDNGPGLAPEHQEIVFAPFTQVDRVRAQGHGLGLAIVRRIVERLGGQVGVTSDGIPGQGSRFWFTLQTTAGPHLSTTGR